MGLFDKLFGTKEIQPKPKVAVEKVQSENLDPEVPGINYKMNDLNVIILKFCRLNPSQRMLNCEFNFKGDPIKSVVVHSCRSSNGELIMDSWLFDTEKPDLFQEKPIGMLYMKSTGKVDVKKGFPINYMAMLQAIEGEGGL